MANLSELYKDLIKDLEQNINDTNELEKTQKNSKKDRKY